MTHTTHQQRPLADFAFEVGRLRFMKRYMAFYHSTPSVTEHTFRVAMLAWLIAEHEGANVGEVLKMALAHDVAEVRTYDHDAVSSQYNDVHEHQAIEDIFGKVLPSAQQACDQYEKRLSLESKIVKDADRLDVLIVIKEFKFEGKGYLSELDEVCEINQQLLFTATAKEMFEEILQAEPLDYVKPIVRKHLDKIKAKQSHKLKVA
jgi:putative hydrolase of HD superfamily